MNGIDWNERIKMIRKLGVATLTLMGGLQLAPPYAPAQEMAPPHPMGPPPAIGPRFCEDEFALFQSKIAFIETKLALRDDQRSSFADFVKAIRAATEPVRRLCPPPAKHEEGDDPLGALSRRERALTAMLSTLKGVEAAARVLSASLTPEQSRILGRALDFGPGGVTGGAPPPPHEHKGEF